ncbi:MAG: hypothetical protein MJ060_00320 [Clostridia bacterium]|nr:hypothetical protein [Clostridia bacterium]
MQRIYHDLYHIAERILQIDPLYEIYWHGELERFEVFWHGKLAFVVPFDALDVRTLTYAQRTRRENADDIEREIDEGNAAIFQEQDKKIQALKAQIKDYVKYDFERFNS